MAGKNNSISIEDMATFCKDKGLVFASAEIYGGLGGFWDFGPLGVELKNNIKNEFWKSFVTDRDDIVGIDGSIITNPKVWKASGHVESFEDDNFNLMFETKAGAGKDAQPTYLRPETAQMIFTNFRLIMESSRQKLPFGIAQAGKAFRNEISPREFLFRSREFEQFEIEYFADPLKKDECPYFSDIEKLEVNMLTAPAIEKGETEGVKSTIAKLVKEKRIRTKWHAYWISMFYKWFLDYGIKKENLRLVEHLKKDLAHYSAATFDIEYKFPFGWREIHGCSDRTDFDLQQHIKHSKKDMAVFDEESKKKIVPHVVAEPSQGIERAFLAFLFDAYDNDQKRGNIVLRISPKLAPYKAAVFPLMNKLDAEAKKVYANLKAHFNCYYDKSGSIGRRYARADEIGVPYCITFDFDTLKDKCVTVRDRDTTKQERIELSKLGQRLQELLTSS